MSRTQVKVNVKVNVYSQPSLVLTATAHRGMAKLS